MKAELEPQSVAKAQAYLQRFRKSAYLIEASEGDSPRTANKMLGAAYLPRGEAWPRCPFCNNKMTLLLQVAVADIAAVAPGLDERGLLQFFCCLNTKEMPGGKPECNGTWGWEIKDRNNLARVVISDGDSGADGPPDHATTESYEINLHPRHIGGAGSVAPRRIVALAPFEDYPHNYENGVNFQDAALRAAGLDRKTLTTYLYKSGAVRRPKIGGWPIWLQGPERLTCPTCRQTMRPLISLSPYEAFHIWSDVYVNIFYCEAHPRNFATEFQNT